MPFSSAICTLSDLQFRLETTFFLNLQAHATSDRSRQFRRQMWELYTVFGCTSRKAKRNSYVSLRKSQLASHCTSASSRKQQKPKTAKAKPKKQHPHNHPRQQAENYVHGSRGRQSQYMNDSNQHQLESEIRQRDKVSQTNKIAMPCIEPYTKLAGQKRGKGSRVKSE